MNETLTGLLKILKEGDPDHQVAAAQVLGQLRPREPEVVRTLAAALSNGNTYLKPFAIDALAAIRSREAMDALMTPLRADGELREKAVRALVDLGSAVEGALLREFQHGDAALRAPLLQVFARTRGKEALALVERALLGEDPAAAQLVQDELANEIPGMEAGERARLGQLLARVLQRTRRGGDQQSQTGILRLLAAIADPRLRPVLQRYTRPSQPPAVRKAALEAMARLPEGALATADLLEMLSDDDFLAVAGPALEVVKRCRLPGSLARRVTRLLGSTRPEVRMFAIQALGQFPNPGAARELLRFLDNEDLRVRETTGQALASNPSARQALLKRLLEARDLDEARVVLEPLKKLARGMAPAMLKPLAERCVQLVDAQSPLREPFAAVLWEANPTFANEFFLAKAHRLRLARRFAEAVRTLLFVAASGHLTEEARYELIVATLNAEPREVGGRVGDPVLGHVAELVKANFPVLQRLNKDPQVAPDHLLYLGLNCAQKVQDERRFGGEAMKLLIRKWPKTKASIQARQMLKVEGLA